MEYEGSAEVEAYRHLLLFKTYEDYLNSLLTPIDLYYLRSLKVAHQLAQLGYRYINETLTRKEFHRRVAIAEKLLHPPKDPETLSSIVFRSDELFLNSLSIREHANRIGKINTIIFIRVAMRSGVEISGYIDFAHRLRLHPWLPIFKGKKVLKPQLTDLGYYNWSTGYSQCSHSENYQIILDPIRGFLFRNMWDHLVFSVDPNLKTPGPNTTRTRCNCKRYLSIILYDHKVRRKC